MANDRTAKDRSALPGAPRVPEESRDGEALSDQSSARRALIALPLLAIRAYQLLLRPLLPPVCRFHPSCSDYATEALHSRGLFAGGLLATWRILRCNPLSRGGYDPVPPRRARGTRPMPSRDVTRGGRPPRLQAEGR